MTKLKHSSVSLDAVYIQRSVTVVSLNSNESASNNIHRTHISPVANLF